MVLSSYFVVSSARSHSGKSENYSMFGTPPCYICTSAMVYSTIYLSTTDKDTDVFSANKIGPPVLAPIPMATDYPEGANVHIICSIVSGERENLEYEWSKDGVKLPGKSIIKQGTKRTQYEIETHPKNELSRLTVSNLTLSDSGEYRCSAKNNLGHSSVSAKLIVTGRWG